MRTPTIRRLRSCWGSFVTPTYGLTECKLVVMRFSDSGGSYLPKVAVGGGHLPMRAIPFVEWWNDAVLKDSQGRTFCRRELVLHVADTDGGAHVDPELDEAYMAISRQNSLGWVSVKGGSVSALTGRPELSCMRQIAHELLCTIYHLVPDFAEHAMPIVPYEA